jgi:hypothetical protein
LGFTSFGKAVVVVLMTAIRATTTVSTATKLRSLKSQTNRVQRLPVGLKKIGREEGLISALRFLVWLNNRTVCCPWSRSGVRTCSSPASLRRLQYI